jgi:hypothetical protein
MLPQKIGEGFEIGRVDGRSGSDLLLHFSKPTLKSVGIQVAVDVPAHRQVFWWG